MSGNKDKMTKHHVYPKRYRKGRSEVKMVSKREHQLWNELTQDKNGQATHPINAMRILAKKFLPSEMEEKFMKEIS